MKRKSKDLTVNGISIVWFRGYMMYSNPYT